MQLKPRPQGAIEFVIGDWLFVICYKSSQVQVIQ
jgi:hypothetical protein